MNPHRISPMRPDVSESLIAGESGLLLWSWRAIGGGPCLTRVGIVSAGGLHRIQDFVADAMLAQVSNFGWRKIKVNGRLFDAPDDCPLGITCFHHINYRVVGKRRRFFKLRRRPGLAGRPDDSHRGTSRGFRSA